MKRNLVIICSPRSNTLTGRLQARLAEQQLHTFTFEEGPNSQWYISDGYGTFISKSFEQEKQYHEAQVPAGELPEKSFEDFAVITKISNPWNPENKIILLAGIRGIGTWAAAECLKKRWTEIHAALPEDQKECDFSVLVRAEYANCDIIKAEPIRVMRIDRKAYKAASS